MNPTFSSPFSSYGLNTVECSYTDDDKGQMMMIRDKIQSAFSSVSALSINGGLIQFWNTNIGSSTRLSTENQPFVLDYFKDPLANEYRLFSLKCQHTITSVIHVKEEDPTTAASCLINNITNGPHAAALMVPHFPEVVLDLKRKKGSSLLVDKALDCGMTCLLLLPVFYDQSKFVGVVECCMKRTSGMVQVFNKLKLALERVGLITYHAQQHLLPAKLMQHGIDDGAQEEIVKALKIVCASYQVALAQVWINYKDVVSPSASLVVVKKQVSDETKQLGMIPHVVKYCGYRSTDSNNDVASYIDIKAYYDTCDVLTLEPGEGFPGRTLETHKAYFCKNVYSRGMSNNDGLLGAVRNKTGASCFSICLRRSSSSSSAVDYAFEFLWSSRSRNQSVLLEGLLQTLKMCLPPSFKFASGAQLGDEVSVVDVTDHQFDSTEIPSFQLLLGNRLSQTTLEEEESKFTQELQRPGVDHHGKRKLHNLHDGRKGVKLSSDGVCIPVE